MCPFLAMHSKGGAHLNEDLHSGSAAQCLAGQRNFLGQSSGIGPLDLQGSLKTAGPPFVSFELLSTSPQTQHKGCIYL